MFFFTYFVKFIVFLVGLFFEGNLSDVMSVNVLKHFTL